MNKKYFILILLTAYSATVCRFFLNNIFFVSFIGSFIYGFVIPSKLRKAKKEILLIGFCSCFTSFSGVVHFVYQFIHQGNYLQLFFYFNLLIISNLIIMHIGFLLSRKMT